VRDFILRKKVLNILDIGGGEKPFLPLDFVVSSDIDYTVLDISQDELRKAPTAYRKIVADITSHNFKIDANFDLCISYMLAEHVRSAEGFHANVFSLTKAGGYAIHFFPTLYNIPIMFNRILPEKVSKIMLQSVQPLRTQTSKSAKFPAYYNWCFGPTRRTIKRLESIGFHVLEYGGLYGHDYYRKVPLLDRIQRRIARELCKMRLAHFTCAAYVILQKPAEHARGAVRALIE
jgi:2-polyprenyl-3-methyl-5-hydroxy-6-metoxy-1,4-benzoquinol methylase